MKFFNIKKYAILSKVLRYSFVIVFFFTIAFSVVCADGIVVSNTIKNPLGDKITDLPSFVKMAIEIVLTVGVPIVVLAIIYTGFLFVKAQGSSDGLKKAKASLTNTLIGAALLLGAFVIAEAIGSTVNEIKDGV